MTAWADIRAGWGADWQRLERTAVKQWGKAAAAEPDRFVPTVEGFLAMLSQTRVDLEAIAALKARPGAPTGAGPAFLALQSRYNVLAAGVMADATPAGPVGVAPVVLVGGLAIGIVGVSWAVAAYQYAANLRDQTQLYREDLAARIAVAQRGQTLPPSTLPQSPPSASMGWLWGLGGLGLLAVGGLACHHYLRA